MDAKAITIGILAHVDAGKTTLAERILYLTGVVRTQGRVDHQDTFLDNHALERERGITIFSKQANFTLEGKNVTLLDTPGHVDFSAEMERSLQVLDYAVLLISAPDGVTGHVMTLWRLLKNYRIPVFVFVNKMDQAAADADRVLAQLREKFGEGFVRMMDEGSASLRADAYEEMATADEQALEEFLGKERLQEETVSRLIRERKLFPCFFGSALKGDGTESFLHFLGGALRCPKMADSFSARVFKISREGGVRLTWLRVTGGSLKVKETLLPGEKADQIRVYNGVSYAPAGEVFAGQVCAVAGPSSTFAGQGLGLEKETVLPVLESVISYSVLLPEGTDTHEAFLKLKQLEEEMPELHVRAGKAGIMIRVMGQVQVEILKKLIPERCGFAPAFGEGHIVYRETIAAPVIGSGHYEPLRHYAEVHLLLEPGERGSGIVFESACPTDSLDLNWQRLIETHVLEKAHVGVLTGSELTDVHVTLLAGRAHLKHTEGGDFREATYRAIRQGLMKTRSILLEPMYRFELELPVSMSGRAMTDIQAMSGSFEGPDVSADGQTAVLTGQAPVSGMMAYESELRSYTHGLGRLSLRFGGYAPCARTEAVCEAAQYDPEADTDNPSGSVFCSHGAGLFVPWQQADGWMHLHAALPGAEKEQARTEEEPSSGAGQSFAGADADDDELMAIFARTYGDGGKNRKRDTWKRSRSFEPSAKSARPRPQNTRPPLLLVDGYNVMYGWEELKKLADENLDAARVRLMDILANFRGYRQMVLILVFDAYKVPGGEGELFPYHGIHVVYTKEAETADSYIERSVHRLAKEFDITVATSDGAEQMIIWGEGARRMSTGELKEEIDAACDEIERTWLRAGNGSRRYLFEEVPPEMKKMLESMRLGRHG